jgi:7-cyano-7-deazaguanine synthase in queuosine biosynthesis
MTLLAWSGGCDSTYTLHTLLTNPLTNKHTNPTRTIAINHPNIPANPQQHLARQKIINHYNQQGITWQHQEITITTNDQIQPISGAGLPQPIIWITHTILYLDQNEDIILSYIQGDDANQYHHHLKKAIKHLQKITRKTGKLQTIEHITKQQVITTLQKQGLYPHTWYCENPQNTQEPPTQEPPTLGPHNLKQNQDPEHSTPCHHCQPCRTHANALWNIQQDNQPKT